MPPSASWNLPMRLSVAPVNEPFSWPNRMHSTRFSGIAPQLTVMNGLPARSLSPWMARAISSLPTPDLAFDQHRDVGGGGALAERDDAVHARRRARSRSAKVSVPSTFFLMRTISPASASILRARADRHLEPLGARRLDHEVDGAGAHRLDGGVDRAVRGLHDDRRHARLAGRCGRARPCRRGRTSRGRAERGRCRRVRRLRGWRRPGRPTTAVRTSKPSRLIDFFQHATLNWIVVDNENALGHGATRLDATDTCRAARRSGSAVIRFRTLSDRQLTQRVSRLPHNRKQHVAAEGSLLLFGMIRRLLPNSPAQLVTLQRRQISSGLSFRMSVICSSLCWRMTMSLPASGSLAGTV